MELFLLTEKSSQLWNEILWKNGFLPLWWPRVFVFLHLQLLHIHTWKLVLLLIPTNINRLYLCIGLISPLSECRKITILFLYKQKWKHWIYTNRNKRNEIYTQWANITLYTQRILSWSLFIFQSQSHWSASP